MSLLNVFMVCLPYLAVVATLATLLTVVARVGGLPQFGRLRQLHRDQQGAVQSLSFVLTIPVFLMLMMVIVQISQLMIARVVMEYAAFTTARSAAVWIPARAPWYEERENQISTLQYNQERSDDLFTSYSVAPDSGKYERIHLAAAMACLPISPSRFNIDAGSFVGAGAAGALQRAFQVASVDQFDYRIDNQLSYSLVNTSVDIEIQHREDEPPLGWTYDIPPYRDEFDPINEIGWQDQIIVTLTHNFALLPGPIRMIANRSDVGTQSTSVMDRNVLYTIELQATAKMNNEGQKPVLPFTQTMPSQPSVPEQPSDPTSGPDDSAGGSSTGSPSSLPDSPGSTSPGSMPLGSLLPTNGCRDVTTLATVNLATLNFVSKERSYVA